THEKPLLIDEQAIQDYRDSLTDFQKEAPFDSIWGCLIEERPIFYVPGEQGRVIYFGHTPNFRIPMRSKDLSRAVTPMDLTPPQLREAAGFDLVDSIFGYVRSTKQRPGLPQACAGRVFFTNATFIAAKQELWVSPTLVTPQILASPKPTTFQHYLVQDTTRNHNPNSRANLAHYGTPTPTETIVRGHKLYWHKRSTQLSNIAETEENLVEDWSQDTQHTQIRPVNKGVQFSFRIYFENLLPIELGALLWALALPAQDEEKRYRHKLGMGKPLGMGSVRITPHLVLSDRRDGKTRDGDVRKGRYSQLFDGDQWYTPERPIKKIDRYLKEFESFVLENMHKTERNDATRLVDVKRIAMLLKMLEWLPGLDPVKSRYMTIEPDDEFSERRVLPTPLDV
ncbi:MAG: TIGR03986 family CRISPR-associated RAMP protein, partial [Caldilineaceae bacterium]|nr:TIGR03986 family CRISPR-associated RAMP protein [Caldilineaceae bacterium]